MLADKQRGAYILTEAEVVELADTLCSGRSAHRACGFKSHLRHFIPYTFISSIPSVI